MPPGGEAPSPPGHNTRPALGLSGRVRVVILKQRTSIIEDRMVNDRFRLRTLSTAETVKIVLASRISMSLRGRGFLHNKLFNFPSPRKSKERQQRELE